MKKKKNLFEKHDLFKIILLAILATIVLTWIIPAGSFSGGTFAKTGLTRTGLADIMLSGLYSTNFFMQQLLFIAFIGIFYGILSQTSGYLALVNKIATKFKGKEKIFVIAISFVIALLTSILTESYVLLTFIPFIIHIASKMKLDKITTFICTFGSMLVGILGATYGYEGFIYFVNYLNYFQVVNITEEIGIRAAILALTFIIYSVFAILHMNKVLDSKKDKEEIVEGLITIEEDKSKKTKVWPMATFMIILFIFMILGYVNWVNNFNVKIFETFHTWLTELAIGDYTVISYILGSNATAFGNWDLFNITIIMAIILIISSIIYRVKIDDLIENAIEGIKKLLKPIILVLGIYIVFVLVYWSPFTVTITNWFASLTDNFNPILSTISAGITSLFHIDFGYTGYVIGDLLTSTYASSFGIELIIYTTLNGLVSFVGPTSVILFFGLSYLDIPYKKWLKYIWKFVLIMFAILLITFALLTYI